MKSGFHSEDISELMNGVLKSAALLNKEIESHFGMSSARILTLLAFTEKEIMRMSELSEEMSLTTSTSTRMIDSLVKEGFVERGYDKFDRRLVTVELTGNGKKISKDIKAYRDMYLTKSSSTRKIDNLVKEGFVERGYEKNERRLVTVSLTGNGKKIAKDIKAFRGIYFESIKDKVKESGEEEMVASLKTLIDAFGNFKSRL